MKKLLLALALTLSAATAVADDVLYPTVPTPEEVATQYLSERSVLVDRATVSVDRKTAMVSATMPSGPLARCSITLQRSETEPSKFEEARWRISGITCPVPAR